MNTKWISCNKRLPDCGEDVILYFHDSFHKHPSWPKMDVKPAWRCNVDEEDSPDGAWAIEGRLGNYVVDLKDGIAWMPLPEPPMN